MRQRQEWEEGFRKQFEQEMEEMRQQLEKSKNDAWKSMDDAWKLHTGSESKENHSDIPAPVPWWTHGKAARCPALNGQEPQKNVDKCPALYDEKGQPRTELDAYNALQPDHDKAHVFQASTQDTPKKPSRTWFSALGWDGKQKENNQEDQQTSSSERPLQREKSWGRPTTYSLWAARRMQPFDNTNDTIPWLMLSPYSPIYLCNPAQSRLFKVKIQDAEGAPLQISNARFFERWYTDVDEKMATQKAWADAFEDLLSLQQTGKMVERDNWNTWRTPRTWFHDMASRGSFGDRWGFNEDGMLIKRIDSAQPKTEDSRASREDRCTGWRRNRDCRRNKSPETIETQPEKSANEENVIVEKVTEALAPFPIFGSIISAADAIVSAVDQAAQKETEAPRVTKEMVPLEEEVSTISAQETNTAVSAHSASSTSYVHETAQNAPKKSIVATLTTTTTRTLPDGTTETRRILKQRFADGSEESDESVEVLGRPQQQQQVHHFPRRVPVLAELEDQNQQKSQAPQSAPKQAGREPEVTKPSSVEASQEQQSSTSAPRRRGSGWFWN